MWNATRIENQPPQQDDYNTDYNDYIVNHGDRIAQGVICKVQQMHTTELINVIELSISNRNKDGFGSSGIK